MRPSLLLKRVRGPKTVDHEKELAELEKKVTDNSTEFLKREELASTLSEIESKLTSSQNKFQDLKEQVLEALNILEGGASTAGSARQAFYTWK